MAEPAVLEELRARVRALEGGGVDFGRAVARLGQPLDAGLPWGGLPYRALHEVGGSAATSAVAAFARHFLARGGPWCGAATRGWRPSWASSTAPASPDSGSPQSG